MTAKFSSHCKKKPTTPTGELYANWHKWLPDDTFRQYLFKRRLLLWEIMDWAIAESQQWKKKEAINDEGDGGRQRRGAPSWNKTTVENTARCAQRDDRAALLQARKERKEAWRHTVVWVGVACWCWWCCCWQVFFCDRCWPLKFCAIGWATGLHVEKFIPRWKLKFLDGLGWLAIFCNGMEAHWYKKIAFWWPRELATGG